MKKGKKTTHEGGCLNWGLQKGHSTWLDDYAMSNAINDVKQIDTEKYEMLSRCKEIFVKLMVENLTSYQASEIVIDKNTSQKR